MIYRDVAKKYGYPQAVLLKGPSAKSRQRDAFWQPWIERYHQLRAAGLGATEARYTVASEIEAAGHPSPSLSTLKRRLK